MGWGSEGQCEHFGARLMGAMEKKSLPGDAQKLMCAWIKIAAQGGIIFTLYRLVEVAFLFFCEWMQRFQVRGSLHQPPET